VAAELMLLNPRPAVINADVMPPSPAADRPAPQTAVDKQI
jgi:hypothetical protein